MQKQWYGLLAMLVLATACTPPTKGNLQANIVGLPSGVNANVVVTGPGSYSKNLTKTELLEELQPGDYTLTGNEVTVGGVTGTTYRANNGSAKVEAGKTVVALVTYQPKPGFLQLTISGLPGGTLADVTVKGPNNFSQKINSSSTLELAPGTYIIEAADVEGAGFKHRGTISGSPATVISQATVNATVNYAPITGRLTINLAGLPVGFSGDAVTVEGPSGTFAVNQTKILDLLEPGNYTVTAKTITKAGVVVDELYDGSGGGVVAVVAAQMATRDISYARRGGTGQLWVGREGIASGWSEAQLGAGGSNLTPSVNLSGLGAQAEAMVFDPDGNLWVSLLSTNRLVKLTPAQLSSSGSPTPAVSINASGSSLSGPGGMAFDSSGNLWVANANNNTVVRFTGAQLASNGSPTPAIVLSANTGSISTPVGLAFDAGGNLWVANRTASSVVQFSKPQLGASGNPAPAVTISANAGSINNPFGLAFDSSGNLWVANFNANTLVRFTPAQLANTGNPAPLVILSANNNSLNGPVGLAFDKAGNLWVQNTNDERLVRFNAASLSASGSPAAALSIAGINGVDIGLIAFSPTPDNLPIQ